MWLESELDTFTLSCSKSSEQQPASHDDDDFGLVIYSLNAQKFLIILHIKLNLNKAQRFTAVEIIRTGKNAVKFSHEKFANSVNINILIYLVTNRKDT